MLSYIFFSISIFPSVCSFSVTSVVCVACVCGVGFSGLFVCEFFCCLVGVVFFFF